MQKSAQNYAQYVNWSFSALLEVVHKLPGLNRPVLNHPKMNIPMTEVIGFFFSLSFNKQELKTPFLNSGERISPIRLKSFWPTLFEFVTL